MLILLMILTSALSPHSLGSFNLNFSGNGLVFSVDISDYVGGVSHDLHITASARYGSGTASLRYMFRFSKQVSSRKFH